MSKNSIHELAEKINQWREVRQSKNQRMPKDLWAKVIDLSTKFPLGTVAKICGIDHSNLLRHFNSYKKNLKDKEKEQKVVRFSNENSSEKSFINLSKIIHDNPSQLKKKGELEPMKCILKMETKTGLCIEVFE